MPIYGHILLYMAIYVIIKDACYGSSPPPQQLDTGMRR